MNQEQLEKRLKEVQKSQHELLARLNVLAGQEFELKYLIKNLSEPQENKPQLNIVENKE